MGSGAKNPARAYASSGNAGFMGLPNDSYLTWASAYLGYFMRHVDIVSSFILLLGVFKKLLNWKWGCGRVECPVGVMLS